MEQRLRDTEKTGDDLEAEYRCAKDALDAWRTRALDAEERERTLIQSTCPDKDAHWRLDEALADLQAAEDRAEQAEKEQGNLRAMKERLETDETRKKAVRELHTGTYWPGVGDEPVCDACDQAMRRPTIRALEGWAHERIKQPVGSGRARSRAGASVRQARRPLRGSRAS